MDFHVKVLEIHEDPRLHFKECRFRTISSRAENTHEFRVGKSSLSAARSRRVWIGHVRTENLVLDFKKSSSIWTSFFRLLGYFRTFLHYVHETRQCTGTLPGADATPVAGISTSDGGFVQGLVFTIGSLFKPPSSRPREATRQRITGDKSRVFTMRGSRANILAHSPHDGVWFTV